MAEIYRMCYDKILPADLRRLATPEFSSGTARMALFKTKKWPNGSTLKVRFLGGTPDQHDFVKNNAKEWCNHANLKLDFGNASDAEIRITFMDDGAWSYIGTDSLDIPLHAATMNFGWLEAGTVLHEFGHALGLIHEHQNPVGGINWNREAVIRDLSGPPNNWDLQTIEHNLFQKYSVDQVNATEVDTKSIMLYAIPSHWTLDGFHSDPNEALSSTDRSYIGNRLNYPFPETEDEAIELPVFEAKGFEGEIGQPGEQDLYRFSATSQGRYTIETEGPTDVILSLYGPDSQTHLIAQDDDSGTGQNAKVSTDLIPGTYFVQVRHYNPQSGSGRYDIRVSRQ
jgi:hypothetical protein